MDYPGYTDTKTLFIIYLKFKFNLASCGFFAKSGKVNYWINPPSPMGGKSEGICVLILCSEFIFTCPGLKTCYPGYLYHTEVEVLKNWVF